MDNDDDDDDDDENDNDDDDDDSGDDDDDNDIISYLRVRFQVKGRPDRRSHVPCPGVRLLRRALVA